MMSLPAACYNDTVRETLLQVDGDIAGLGVRLSFYLQTFILVLLVDRSPDDAPSALWTLTATSCGLTVAAIVQVASQSLSLLEAIIVSQLVWLANVACLIAQAAYSRSKGSDLVVKFASVGQGYLSMVLTIVMWTYASKLGKFSECNGAVEFVVLFGIRTPALGHGRTVSLVFASAALSGYTCLTLMELKAWWKNGRTSRLHTHKETARGRMRRKHTGKKVQDKARRNKWICNVSDNFVGVVLAVLIIFAYFLTTTELILKATGVDQEANHDWGFGQVFAIMVVTPSGVSLYRGIKANGFGKRKDQQATDRAAEEGRAGNSDVELASPMSQRPSETGLQPPANVHRGPSSSSGRSSIRSC